MSYGILLDASGVCWQKDPGSLSCRVEGGLLNTSVERLWARTVSGEKPQSWGLTGHSTALPSLTPPPVRLPRLHAQLAGVRRPAPAPAPHAQPRPAVLLRATPMEPASSERVAGILATQNSSGGS